MRGIKLPHGLKPEGLGGLSGRRLHSRRSLKQASAARREDGSRDLSSDNEPDGCKGSWPERSARSPRPAGVRARGAGPKQPEKMVGGRGEYKSAPMLETEKPAKR